MVFVFRMFRASPLFNLTTVLKDAIKYLWLIIILVLFICMIWGNFTLVHWLLLYNGRHPVPFLFWFPRLIVTSLWTHILFYDCHSSVDACQMKAAAAFVYGWKKSSIKLDFRCWCVLWGINAPMKTVVFVFNY